MRSSKIKAKLAKGEAALCTQLHITDPSVFELTSLMGLDAIWMDLEHHGYSLETAGQLMRPPAWAHPTLSPGQLKANSCDWADC